MHPKLFDIPLPDFLAKWLGVNHIPVYTYAFFIVLGAVAGCWYIKRRAKIELNDLVLPYSFFYSLFLAGFIGGKLFFYLERPGYYFDHPKLLLDMVSGGFVCYGSMIFIILFVVFYTRQHKISTYGFLDIIAIPSIFSVASGRIGCFFGGCCYGKPTDSFLGVVFPTTTPLAVYPTQLYEALLMGIILICLLFMKKFQTMKGQLFLLNICLYAIGRFFLEFIRGDFRGVVFNGFISPAQTTAIAAILIAFILFVKLKKQYQPIT